MTAVAKSGPEMAPGLPSAPPSHDWRVLSAGRGRPAPTPFAALVPALPVVVPASRCGASCLTLVGPHICWLGGGTRDIPVEALLPEGRERFEWGSSGWSRVLRIDAVGGPPHGDFANEGCARVASRSSPGWRHLGRRDPGPGRRGLRQVEIALPDIGPTRDDHEVLPEYRKARAADLGW